MSIAFHVVLSALIASGLAACAPDSPTIQSNAVRLEKVDAMYQDYRKDFPDVNEVTPQGLLDLEEAGNTVLVDVRTSEEQAVSMLPGAITAEAFEAAHEMYRDKTVVTYCTIGARSGVLADELRQKGYDVFNLKGSLLAWTHAGLPLMDKEGHETKRVHVYGQKWDLAAEGYDAEW